MGETDSLVARMDKSNKQLRSFQVFFRGLVEKDGETEATDLKYAEIIIEDNIKLLNFILSYMKEGRNVHAGLDAKAIKGLLEEWFALQNKIREPSQYEKLIFEMKEKMEELKKEIAHTESFFSTSGKLFFCGIYSLRERIGEVEKELDIEFPIRRLELEELRAKVKGLGEEGRHQNSVDSVEALKPKLNELIKFYETTLKMGTLLLKDLRELDMDWEDFEAEQRAYDRLVQRQFVAFGGSIPEQLDRTGLRELEGWIGRIKEHATEIKARLPWTSPLQDALDIAIEQAETDFSNLNRLINGSGKHKSQLIPDLEHYDEEEERRQRVIMNFTLFAIICACIYTVCGLLKEYHE